VCVCGGGGLKDRAGAGAGRRAREEGCSCCESNTPCTVHPAMLASLCRTAEEGCKGRHVQFFFPLRRVVSVNPTAPQHASHTAT